MVARLRLTLLLGASLAAGCKDKAPPPAPAPAPVDHLAPNEAAEGQQKAFTLPLPLHARVTGRFDTIVTVRSPLTPEDLAGFVRARVKDGKVSGTGRIFHFDDVVVTAAPERTLTIEVRPATYSGDIRSEMSVRDTTPPPVEKGLSDEERWKRQGFTPNGKLLDPKHTE